MESVGGGLRRNQKRSVGKEGILGGNGGQNEIKE